MFASPAKPPATPPRPPAIPSDITARASQLTPDFRRVIFDIDKVQADSWVRDPDPRTPREENHLIANEAFVDLVHSRGGWTLGETPEIEPIWKSVVQWCPGVHCFGLETPSETHWRPGHFELFTTITRQPSLVRDFFGPRVKGVHEKVTITDDTARVCGDRYTVIFARSQRDGFFGYVAQEIIGPGNAFQVFIDVSQRFGPKPKFVSVLGGPVLHVSRSTEAYFFRQLQSRAAMYRIKIDFAAVLAAYRVIHRHDHDVLLQQETDRTLAAYQDHDSIVKKS